MHYIYIEFVFIHNFENQIYHCKITFAIILYINILHIRFKYQ